MSGLEQSTYLIEVTKKGETEIEDISDIFTIYEDVEQQLIMKSREIIIFEIDSDQNDIVFKFDSTGKIAACQI